MVPSLRDQATPSPPPTIPERERNGDPTSNAGPRNYTIVGNFKIAFPQWRLIRYQYPGKNG